MRQLSSRLGVRSAQGVTTDRTARVLMACTSAVLVTVAVAAGDPEWPSPDSGAPSAEQGGRPWSPYLGSKVRKKSPPPATDSDYESDGDCE